MQNKHKLSPLIVPILAFLVCACAGAQEEAWKQLAGYYPSDKEKLRMSFPVKGAKSFGQNVVIDCGDYKLLDYERQALKPLVIDGSSKLYAIAADQCGLLFALAKKEKVLLKIGTGQAWRDVPIPADVQANPKEWRMVAGDGAVALLSTHKFHVLKADGWISHANPSSPPYVTGDRQKFVMKSGLIYVSSDAGEWGGSVVEINTTTGVSKEIFGDGLNPVTDLDFDSNGRLWFCCGCRHLGISSGALFSYAGKITRRSEVRGIPASIRKMDWHLKEPTRINWRLEPTSFEGLHVAHDGSIFVATSDYGLMSLSKDGWKQVTPGWPENVPVCGLEMKPGFAILPIFDRGIVVFDMQKKSYRFVLPDYPNGRLPF